MACHSGFRSKIRKTLCHDHGSSVAPIFLLFTETFGILLNWRRMSKFVWDCARLFMTCQLHSRTGVLRAVWTLLRNASAVWPLLCHIPLRLPVRRNRYKVAKSILRGISPVHWVLSDGISACWCKRTSRPSMAKAVWNDNVAALRYTGSFIALANIRTAMPQWLFRCWGLFKLRRYFSTSPTVLIFEPSISSTSKGSDVSRVRKSAIIPRIRILLWQSSLGRTLWAGSHKTDISDIGCGNHADRRSLHAARKARARCGDLGSGGCLCGSVRYAVGGAL